MQLIDYLNQVYDSDNIRDYEYGKINPEIQDLPDPDKEILELILDIVRLKENYKEKENVFQQFNSKHLPELKSITRDDISSLLSVDLFTLPLAIRARVADFLWTIVKDSEYGKSAVHSYLDLYHSLWDEDHWTDCIDAIYRAINIAVCFGKNGKEYRDCIKAVIDGLNCAKGNDGLFLSTSLLEILSEQRYKVNSDIIQHARNAVETAKRDRNLNKAQSVLEVLTKLDPSNRNLYFEEAGDITQDLAFKPALRRVHILTQALQYYQKAGAEEKKIQCRKLIEEAQSHVREEMQVIKTDPIDISSIVKQVQESINKTQSVKQAIIVFSDFVHIYSKDELLKYVQSEGVFTNLVTRSIVDKKGRQIYTLSPYPLDERIDKNEERVQQHMWDKARTLQEINADAVLKYAISELNKRYEYNEDDLDFLVNDNAAIPKGREKIIRKGFFLGLKGDLYAALHILIPQMESIIRYFVELCGGKTFHIKKDGNVEDCLLGSLLDSAELNDSYDPDILFCLKGLLDRKEGSNLRNEFAHGFMEPGNSLIELYFLGFLIKFLSWYSKACREERENFEFLVWRSAINWVK